ncbi:MAG TPA: VCBS repeat-containing protein, partial [Acidimicrobiales bacterium]
MRLRRESGADGPVASARRLAVLGAVALSSVGIVASPAAAAGPGTLTLVRTLDRTVTSWGPNTGTDEAFSTPAVSDVNHDGTPEIIVAGNDGVVTAWRTNGTRMWATNVGGPVDSSPSVVDINGDGNRDVLVGTMAGTVVYLNGPTGAIVHTFHDTPSEACAPGVYCKPRGFFATPVASDLDGDGKPEIIATSWDHQLYAWHRDGTPYFRKFVRDTIWSSPTVVDIDGDGHKEIIFGGDRTGSPDGGYLWMFKYNGALASGFPKILGGQTIWSSPSVADIDGDRKLDIVVGTGLNYPRPAGDEVYAFDSRGTLKPG